MGDIAEDIDEAVDKARESRLNSFVAILVAITATFMALGGVKDGNIVQSMQQDQTNSVDQWAYYQAKSTKQHMAEVMVDQLTIQRQLGRDLSEDTLKMVDAKIADYKGQVARYDKEKAEIKAKAEAYEADFNGLNVHDDQFDMSEACLSLAIALAGVTALTQKRWLFAFAVVLAFCGLLLGVAGFIGLSMHPDWLAKLLT